MSRIRKLHKAPDKKQQTQLTPQKNDSAKIQQARIEQQFFAGPLPHPDILSKYDDILAGAADRIITMAENQAEHRQKIEQWRERSEIVLSFSGQVCALIFVLVMVIAAAYCIIKGQPLGGVGLGVTGIVSIVYAFIRGHKQRERSSSSSEN